MRTDFGALRTWIANNETLKEESRRYLLLVDSIRQCEGVARLLLSRPGDLVDVKPSKNKVAPLGINFNQNIPSLPKLFPQKKNFDLKLTLKKILLVTK